MFPQDRQLLGCFFGRRFLIIPCSFFFCSVLANRSGCSFSLPVCSLDYPSPAQPSLFLTGYFNAQVSGFQCPSPAPPRLFLTGYFDARISGFRCLSPAPPRLFLTGYFAAQVSGFRCPSPTPPRLFSTGYFDAQVPAFRYPSPATSSSDRLFGRPGLPFSVPQGLLFAPCFWSPWSSFSTPSFFTTQPSLPGYLGGRLALCAALRYTCGFYRSAVFTAPLSLVFFGGLCSSAALMLYHPTFSSRLLGWPARSLCRLTVRLRFLPLRGFYRSAVFTAPLSPVFWGLCSSAALMLAAPQSSPSSGRTLWYRLVRSVSVGPPFLTLFLYRLVARSRSVTAHLTGFPFVHFIHIRGPSIVSSFECRDTGTTCTTTSLMGPFGYRKLGNLTYHRLL